jgi:hypothetical protein
MDAIRLQGVSAMPDKAAAGIPDGHINEQLYNRTADESTSSVSQQDDDEVRVSFGQKLLSASAGSLVTSLIGW